MTAYEFNQKFAKRVKSERKITNEILQDINHAKAEKFHLALGFSSLFDWLTRGHGYSGSAAQRRIQAARLLESVPDLATKLESGETNLTVAAQTQSAFMQSQKLGRKISNEQKAEVIEELSRNNSYEAERKLMIFFPELEQAPRKDSQKAVAHNRSRVTSDLSDNTIAVLNRVKELLSHKFPEGAMDDILFHIGSDYLNRNDPLRKSTAVAANHRVKKTKAVPRPVNRVIIQNSNDQCEYRDPVTGRRCLSRYQTETDHIQMRALGGTHTAQNLRRLCRAHNQFLAEKILGKKQANRWRMNFVTESRR